MRISIREEDLELLIDLSEEAVDNMQKDGDPTYTRLIESWNRISHEFSTIKQMQVERT